MIVPHRLPAAEECERGKNREQDEMAHAQPCGAPEPKNLRQRRADETRGAAAMAYWLMKSEPGSYGWADLVRDGAAEWDGVRNPAARLHLKAMREGDEALFYHSGAGKAAVGIMRVARAAAPDPKDPNWVSVAVEPVRALPSPVTLKTMKSDGRLAAMEMLRQSRLSVSPLRQEEWAAILELAGG
jgi:predicted RNA-binding protein with PUA-like domain